MLYNIINRRHGKTSTVITTNLRFKEWGTVFPGAACVVALVDRFTEHCHVFEIDGDSWRQREQPALVVAEPEPSPPVRRRLPKKRGRSR